MNEKKYIQAIEELNKEYLNFTHSKIYLKNNRKRKFKILVKNLAFKRLYFAFKTYIYNKFNKANKISTILKNTYNLKRGNKVVYTCIMNKYDKLRSPLLRTKNTDYFVFSDDPNIIKETSCWQYKEISEKIKKKCNNNPILINRYIKMHPHELFKEYDLALYVDGNVRVISNIEECFGYINDKTGLAMHDHSKRNDVYEEAKACIKLNKGNKKNIKQLVKEFKEENFPYNYGLFEAGVIAIDLKNKNSKIILNDWYQDFIKSETERDQLTLPYVLWKNNFKFIDVGILGNNLYDNPKFRIYDHNFKSKKRFWVLRILRNKIKNFGWNHTCNLCFSKVKKWKGGGVDHQIFINNKIIGAGYRERFQCPVCGAKDKDRLVFYYIKKYTDMLKKPCTILHFAPERLIKYHLKFRSKISKKTKYYNGDLNPKNGDMIIDITNIDFPDNKFDYIICNHVLEHIVDEKKAFNELKRVIKPNGKIILTVPVCISNEKTIEDNSITDPRERMNMFCQEDHVRLYGKDFADRIEKYGLKVKEFKVNNKAIEEKYGLLEDGIIYIISKEK